MKLVVVTLLLLLTVSVYGEDACKAFPEVAPKPQTLSATEVQRDHPTWRNWNLHSSGSHYSASTSSGETELLSIKSGKTLNIGKGSIIRQTLDGDSLVVQRYNPGGMTHISGIVTGDFKRFDYSHTPPNNQYYTFSPDGRYSVYSTYASENGTSSYFLELTDLQTGTTKKIKWPDYVNSDSIEFTPDGKYVIAGSGSRLAIYNIESGNFTGGKSSANGYINYHPKIGKTIEISYNGKITVSEFDPEYHFSDDQVSFSLPNASNCSTPRSFSADYSRFFVTCGRRLFSVDLKLRKVIDETSIDVADTSVSFSPNLRFASSSSWSEKKTSLIQIDESGHFTSNITLPYLPNGNSYQATDNGFTGFRLGSNSDAVTLKKVCPIPLDPGKCPNCGTDSVGSLPLDSIHKKWLEEVELNSLCKLPFKAEDWDRSFPIPASEKLSEKELMAFLLRFQKKGGFEYGKHLQMLVTILNSALSVKEPQLMVGMLQNINLEHSWLYDYLLQIYPNLSNYSPDSQFVNPCRTADETKNLNEKALKYSDDRIATAGPAQDFTYFEPLKLYTPILANLPKEKKTKDIEKITEAVRGAAIGDDLLRNVFPSKLYYLAMGAISPLFGEHHEGIITDLTYERGYNGEVIPLLLGPSSIGDSQRTRYGFHARKLPPLNINKDATTDQTFKVRWHQNGEKFEGTMKLEHVDTKDLVSTEKSPNYKELYKDEKMTGVIMVGSNLKSSAPGLLDNYLQYYLDQGFQFGETKTKIPDMLAFFKEGVEKGGWDYFVKEAHSDGDDKNLFRFDKKSDYLKGVKHNADGTTEEVYLVFPDQQNNDSVLLSNQDFGEWVRNRKRDGKGQIFYFNTSCSSSYKAVREVEAARTAHLVDIATSNSALTFSNHSGSAFRALLHGFRSGKSYADIRADMAAIPGYNRSSKDGYLFPDEPEYKSHITDKLMPYGIQIGIKDGRGKDYHIDEVLRSFH